MKYTYDRYWGIFTRPSVASNIENIVGYGYSGNASALNDIHKQNLKGVGPLPAATYVITEIYDDPHRGKHTCRLKPALGSKMYDRDSFLIHGDTAAEAHDASDGCIIAPFQVRSMFMVQDIIEVM